MPCWMDGYGSPGLKAGGGGSRWCWNGDGTARDVNLEWKLGVVRYLLLPLRWAGFGGVLNTFSSGKRSRELSSICCDSRWNAGRRTRETAVKRGEEQQKSGSRITDHRRRKKKHTVCANMNGFGMENGTLNLQNRKARPWPSAVGLPLP